MFSSDEKVQILATMNTWSNDNLREPSESSKEEKVMKYMTKQSTRKCRTSCGTDIHASQLKKRNHAMM